MEYGLKLEKAKKELTDHGLSITTTPFLSSWISKFLGIKLKPPYYCSFIHNFIHSTLSYSSIWFLVIKIMNSISPDDIYHSTSYENPIVSSLIFGGVSGLFLSIYYKGQFIKKRLTRWTTL